MPLTLNPQQHPCGCYYSPHFTNVEIKAHRGGLTRLRPPSLLGVELGFEPGSALTPGHPGCPPTFPTPTGTFEALQAFLRRGSSCFYFGGLPEFSRD